MGQVLELVVPCYFVCVSYVVIFIGAFCTVLDIKWIDVAVFVIIIIIIIIITIINIIIIKTQ